MTKTTRLLALVVGGVLALGLTGCTTPTDKQAAEYTLACINSGGTIHQHAYNGLYYCVFDYPNLPKTVSK